MYKNMLIEMAKAMAVQQLSTEGQKRIDKDTNDTGSDDTSGRVMKATADAISKLDLSGMTNPKSLDSMGKMFEAFGKKLQKEAANLG